MKVSKVGSRLPEFEVIAVWFMSAALDKTLILLFTKAHRQMRYFLLVNIK